MSRPIEDYALIGDLHAAALVSRDGSVDWLCLPRFDSEACFTALLGDERHGHWRIAPAGEITQVRREYLPGTLVLETEFSTATGTVRLTDCMPPRRADPVLIRLVEGVRGRVDMRMTLAPRFEYGLTSPRLQRTRGTRRLVAGAQALWLFSPLELRSQDGAVLAWFPVEAGDQVPVVMVWRPSYRRVPDPPAPVPLVSETARWWREWVAALRFEGEWQDAVARSLITLKALSYAPTGGLVAAPTTSLPQQPSGVRNWDYRYCWIRDAAAGLDVFRSAGADREAAQLLGWLAHAVAGPAAEAQPVYRVAGERRMPEMEADWLPGYEGAQPVRIGNAAASRAQHGTFGYVLRARLAARLAGLPAPAGPANPAELLAFLRACWAEPDSGIWEMRGPLRHFVHSKAMIWAAADAAARLSERFGELGAPEGWRHLAAAVRADVLQHGYDPARLMFAQSYGSAAVDASLLQLPLLGFLPATDPRVAGTVAAIRHELDDSGVLLRYQPHSPADADGLPPGEAGYVPASFWLVQYLAAAGQAVQARRLFLRLLELRNDVGLLAEGYDPLRRRFAGNHPLAAAHIGLIAAAQSLSLAAEDAWPGQLAAR